MLGAIRHRVTPLMWGEQFHFKKLVNTAAMKLIRDGLGQLSL